MRRNTKRRLRWIVLVGILVSAIAFFAIALISARTELKEIKAELKVTESVLEDTRDQEQVEAFLRTAVVLYTEGRKKEAIRFLEYAIYKMDARRNADLGILPAKMLKDPRVAKKLGLKLAKGSQKNRHFGGG